MATREGIYVGGHEIVKRYVGDRLIWSKNIFQDFGRIFFYVSVPNDSNNRLLCGIPSVTGYDNDKFWNLILSKNVEFQVTKENRKIQFTATEPSNRELSVFSDLRDIGNPARSFYINFKNPNDMQHLIPNGLNRFVLSGTIYKKKEV